MGLGGVWFFLYYFAPAPAQSSHRKLSHAPAEKKGEAMWAPATSSPASAAPLSPTSFLQKQRGRQERDDYFRITNVQRLGCRGYSGRGSVPFLACLMPAELATCCRVWVRSLPFGKEKGKILAFPWVLGSADWHSG